MTSWQEHFKEGSVRNVKLVKKIDIKVCNLAHYYDLSNLTALDGNQKILQFCIFQLLLGCQLFFFNQHLQLYLWQHPNMQKLRRQFPYHFICMVKEISSATFPHITCCERHHSRTSKNLAVQKVRLESINKLFHYTVDYQTFKKKFLHFLNWYNHPI